MSGTSRVPEAYTSAVFTIPNIITVTRFLGTPLFVWLVLAREEYGWGVFILALMGCTDWIDGFVARKLNQTSRLGRIIDPLADRVALVTVILTLAIAGILPFWLLLIILIPDLILLSVTLYYFHGDANMNVTMVGKCRTAALMVGTPILLLAAALDSSGVAIAAWSFLILGMVLHVIAFVQYLGTVVAKHRELDRTNARQGRP